MECVHEEEEEEEEEEEGGGGGGGGDKKNNKNEKKKKNNKNMDSVKSICLKYKPSQVPRSLLIPSSILSLSKFWKTEKSCSTALHLHVMVHLMNRRTGMGYQLDRKPQNSTWSLGPTYGSLNSSYRETVLLNFKFGIVYTSRSGILIFPR